MVASNRVLVPLVVALGLLWSPLPADDRSEDSSPLPRGLKRGWYARIETVKGEIVARLLPEQAPRSVASFAALAEGRLEWTDPLTGETRKGRYYDGLPVTLVSAGRMFVVGDRSQLGEGTPELYVPPEGAAPVTFSGGLRLGMVRSGGRVSGVLFFVTASGLREMDGMFPCFGEVVSGKEVIFQISQAKSHPDGVPLEPMVIERVSIVAVDDPPPLPEPVPYFPKPAKPAFSREKPTR